MTMRVISLDEIKEREMELWSEHTYLAAYPPSDDLRRRLRRQVYRPAECIGYGFMPLAYDDGQRPWLFARRAMCMRCGHVLATNQPSWMRKHNRNKHFTREHYYGSELLYPKE